MGIAQPCLILCATSFRKPIVSNKTGCLRCAFRYSDPVAYEFFKRQEQKMIDFTPPRAASRSVRSGAYLPLGEGLFLIALMFIVLAGI
jgi:hypothetical protein